MHRHSLAVVGVLTLLCLAGWASHPGAQQEPGTFRARITLVPIDVRVVDREGSPVTDLRQEDFIVLEDGVRQQIRHFSLQTFGATTTSPSIEEKPMLRKVPKLELMPQANRVFLIVPSPTSAPSPAVSDGTRRAAPTRILTWSRFTISASRMTIAHTW
jgi:hypothetical protein